ncbi:MAG: glycosyltransferase family 4 protein [Candidatus Methylomirabilia bacterium]
MSAEPIRVLQLYPKADYFTGAAIQLHGLARGLRARGHHVVMGTRPSEIWARKCAVAEIPHFPLPMRSAMDLRSVRELVRILRRERIQVVHCHKGRARTLAILAGLFVKIAVLVLNRGVSFRLSPFNRLGYTTRRVTAIVAVSHSIKRGLVAAGVPEEKIEVIHSGTNTEHFHPSIDGSGIRRELGLSSDRFLVAQVGVRSWRGNDDVLDAMAQVVAHAPRAHLLFVGSALPRAAVFLDKARSRGLEERMHVWGHREDIPEILAAADLTVDASYAGAGLTGSLRESLAVETPVIGTAVAGIPELVLDGETGLLVPPRSPDALARAILRVMEHPVEAREMARAGRKRVEAEFSTQVKVERTEALYRHLLAARS